MGKRKASERHRNMTEYVGAKSGRPVVSMVNENVGELKLTHSQQAKANAMYERMGTRNCCMICGDTEKLKPMSQGLLCEFCYNYQKGMSSESDVSIANPATWMQFMRM